MHTDEYEISIGREITLCRNLIERLEGALLKREQRYGMSSEEFLKAFQEGRLAERNRDMERWRDDHRDLQKWKGRLREYEEALQTAKRM